MKKISFTFLLLGVLAFIPATSYALFDIGVYGGYSYKNDVDTSGTLASGQEVPDPTPKGFTYGVIGHYNQPIFPLIRIGIGLYSQYSRLEYDYNYLVGTDTTKVDVTYGKKVVGIDLYLQLDIPLLPLHPYVKFASAMYEDYDGDLKDADKEYFNTYSTGIGFALTFFPLMQIFAEYRYDYVRNAGVTVGTVNADGTEKIEEEKAVGHTIFLGVRAFL